jgi:hypothetical protein
MTDLSQRTELYELKLPYGLTVTMKRLTTAGIVAARRTVEVIERQARMCRSVPAKPDAAVSQSQEPSAQGARKKNGCQGPRFRSLRERRQPQVVTCCGPSSLRS